MGYAGFLGIHLSYEIAYGFETIFVVLILDILEDQVFLRDPSTPLDLLYIVSSLVSCELEGAIRRFQFLTVGFSLLEPFRPFGFLTILCKRGSIRLFILLLQVTTCKG